MYYLIEHSPTGITVVGTFTTREEAQNEIPKFGNDYCDYVVTKVT